jgi:hypothetical protein
MITALVLSLISPIVSFFSIKNPNSLKTTQTIYSYATVPQQEQALTGK